MFYWCLTNGAKRVGLRNLNGKQKIKSRRQYFVFVRVCALRGRNVTPLTFSMYGFLEISSLIFHGSQVQFCVIGFVAFQAN